MSKPAKRERAQTTKGRAKRVRAFLADLRTSSNRRVCLTCGSTAGLLEGIMVLWGIGKRWKTPVYFCETCVSEESARSASIQSAYDSTEAVNSPRKGLRVQ